MDKYLREIQSRGILSAINPAYYRRHGDHIEQSPWELANFAQWIENHGGIKSYMEIGVSNGGTLKFIVDMFKPENVYAADLRHSKLLPPKTNFFKGDTRSQEFRSWLSSIPYVDLIFIDADHKYESVCNDYDACKTVPHKWMAFHDICGLRDCEGSKKHWDEIKKGRQYLQWINPSRQHSVGIGLLHG